ncbi:Na+/H+ antiporter subunit E [Candidatus Anaplasma sp. TIGMIC]|uniref:Na+/H+ antiporter subunit E n=1 Tax=Candidatus Anaplasma sp. TIGMIC TaxID=3020713 RepID=UPI00232CCD67|nr:Na+/H+ antiporter subunit E [Candidatus Anaplasma sp. TIGMIC]MDB1135363.1 Na+/H+ antiporter subunit E [Candidatus Anaplasma sp. TIGMIC]
MWSFVVQICIWLVFSGYFDTFFVTAGIISAALSVLLQNHISGSMPVDDYRALPQGCSIGVRCAKNVLLYSVWLVGQIASSTLYVTKRVFLSSKLDDSPVVTVVDTNQRSGLGLFVLSNSITITPGTIGMGTTAEGKVKVLALDNTLLSGVSESDDRICRAFCIK